MREITELLQEGIQAEQFGGPIEPHGHHAMGFFAFSGITPLLEYPIMDIGSGAGLPALPLIEAYPRTSWTLIERRDGRCALLKRAIRRLGYSDRVEVRSTDVAVAARDPHLRDRAGVVTARSFGSPADTAECAAPLLRRGGLLVTSEPEDGDRHVRWPDTGLEQCGLTFETEWSTAHGFYRAFRRSEVDLASLPRPGARKRLLF